MFRAAFQDLAVGTYSSGVTKYSPGVYTVYVDVIPSDAPQDWEMGPKMRPGEFGLFLENMLFQSRHSPYALATGKTEKDVKGAASGWFKKQVGDWQEVVIS